MKTASVGEIQKNFSQVLNRIKAGEEVCVTKHGKIVGKFTAAGPQSKIEWPDFMNDALEVKGRAVSRLIQDDREERF